MRRVLVVALVACSSRDAPAPPPPTQIRGLVAADSTIAARDYIGPDACGECHLDQHARWKTSLHAVMNQRAERATVIGDFRDVTLGYRGGTVKFGRDLSMTLTKDGSTTRYRITRTIGKRGLQEYVGVADGSSIEVRLPFGWWPRRGGWYPQPYFDPWLTEDTFDAYTEVGEPWAERCPWCHSTYPFAQRIARASMRAVGHGFEQFFDPTGEDRPASEARRVSTAPGGSVTLDVSQQVTVGISCESCHLGGRAHAAGAAIHFVPIGAEARAGAPRPSTFTAERADPAIANRVCAQCHSGPSPRFANGAATRNSSEALDLAASPCTTARCVDCHDPHGGGSDDARSIAACVRCHPTQADRAHAGKDHATTTCLDCHMPRIVLGIAGHVRTHRIGRAGGSEPNACNLCHLDRSFAWTTDELRRGWAARVDLGRDDTPVGEFWLTSKQPALRLVAAAAYARSKLGRSALPQLARLLEDPLPHVRAWAVFAVEDILGRKLRDSEYDPRAPKKPIDLR